MASDKESRQQLILHEATYSRYGVRVEFEVRVLLKKENKVMDMRELQRDTVFHISNESEKLINLIASDMISDTTAALTIENKDRIKSFFPFGAIYMQKIPNEYSSDIFYAHYEWFLVYTEKGPFKVGHRKRVWEITWTEEINPASAEELFRDEEGITKFGRTVHAWSDELARRYIRKIYHNGVGD